MRPADRFRRRNAAYVRQGEWFLDEEEVLIDERLTRGRGKAHVIEFAFRRGGETVYVSDSHPTGITEQELERLSNAELRRHAWRQMIRDPELYARGRVRHPDHNTIVLHGWHRVLMNTERGARAMRHVAFLD